MGHGPLAGVRLIEMDAVGPVPLAGMILAGMGAEVVQIARPPGGPWADIGGAVLHRGKTQIELNVRETTDRARLLDLIEQADALIEGSRPGAMERLGLGPDICLARNPRLVYARLTGWGQEGPLAQTAGHDINYIAMTGALHAIGAANAPPTVPLNLVGDYAGGTMFAVAGILAALHSAKSTSRGQVVDIAMVDGVATLLAMFHAFLANGTWQDSREVNLLDGAMPFYRCYACRDGGHVAVGSLEPQFFAILIERLGFAPDAFQQHDPAGWPSMMAAFAERFAQRTRGEWEAIFSGSDACVMPVLSMREAMAHPALAARGTFSAPGGIGQASLAPRFSGTPGAIGSGEACSAEELRARWSASAAQT